MAIPRFYALALMEGAWVPLCGPYANPREAQRQGSVALAPLHAPLAVIAAHCLPQYGLSEEVCQALLLTEQP